VMTRVGVVGGGQLARMMIPAAINLGIDLSVFAESANSSAKLAVTMIGDYTKWDELEKFASTVEVITFDHEHVPLEHLEKLRSQGQSVYPPPQALALTHNKILMREAFSRLELPQPLWAVADNRESLVASVDAVGGLPCVAKLPVGGYDGKGVRVIDGLDQVDDWLAQGPVLLEEKVDFVREIAQLVARTPTGERAAWPCVETRQVGGVCSVVIAPATDVSAENTTTAAHLAHVIATEFDVVGILAVEIFECPDGQLLINELAVRPHNSGHVFTELSVTSQFEQHLRAVSGYPLGATDFICAVGVMVNIFGEVNPVRAKAAAQQYPQVKIHSYQKPARPGRKAGHLVVVGDDANAALGAALDVKAILEHSQ
jgi:5-(carboxyamino)imidazole ribonucleotide synthase